MNLSHLASCVLLPAFLPAQTPQQATPPSTPAMQAPSTEARQPPAPTGMFGNWKTAGGAVVSTIPCPSGLCLRVETLSPTAPGTIDHNNPDASLRDRPICRLEIGNGFSVEGDHASNGRVYDPMSGKTYKATLKLDSPDTLKLRGYVGFSALGRTETWQRTTISKPCS